VCVTPERWQRIDEVLEAALERGPTRWAAFLDEACAEDEELRREVESLLRAHEQAGSFIEGPPAEAAGELLGGNDAGLLVGRKLGHYEIIALLGTGGMGEVYLARDSRLGRRVAIKLLPASFTKDEERVRRFEQEARAASALNHPNILTIFDIERADGFHFIATEYIEGMTLREHVAAAKLSLSEALDVAIQVASALSAAHQAGIVHRDVKPENIMLRPDGYVKVLDFGLAKLTEREAKSSGAESQAFRAVKTETGVVMGTTQYMSPEQAKGQHVDQRSDVFSFGTVFYEMLTGEQAFRRDSDVDTLHALIHEEPVGLSKLYKIAPADVERVVRRSLEKEADRRYQNGAELVTALKQAASAAVSTSPWIAWLRWRQGWWIALTVVVLIVLGAVALSALKRAGEAPSKPASEPQLGAMRTVPFTGLPGLAFDPSFSPDGSYVAFVSTGEEGNPDIYVKLVDGGTPVRLTRNPALDISPVWSPDGRYIAFARLSGTERAVFVIPAMGGSERKLFSTNSVHFVGWGGRINWSADGEYIAYSDTGAPGKPFGVFLFTLKTQELRPLTSAPEHWGGDTQPVFSPDSQKVAFVRMSSADTGDIYVVATAGGEPRRLTFDNQYIAGMAWTPDGREIVFSSDRGDTSNLWRISATGGEAQPVGVGSEGAQTPAISRHGHRLVYSRHFQAMSTWRINLPDSPGKPSSKIKVLATTTRDEFPQISPDGMRIAFGSRRSGPREIWVCDSDGSNLLKLTALGRVAAGMPHWSPDGRWIAFDSRPAELSDIYVIGANGGQPRRLTDDLADDTDPSWSRDGRWIYFASNRSGEVQIWKISAEGGEAIQVTRQGGIGGIIAFESPDGRYVYYTNDDRPADVRRKPVEGGEEQVVLRGVHPFRWALAEKGVYFAEPEEKGGVIKLFNFATRKVTRVVTMEKPPILTSGLAVSPDGRWLLYSQLDVESADIMLVENFR
jgi:Tol biopolymer transport system component/predicted Ser/Thr protein kinase